MNATQHNLSDVNVTMVERTLSVFTGSALLLYGMRNRGVTAAGAALLGGGLLARGMTGRSQLYNALGINTASEEERLPAKRAIRVEKTLTINAPAEKLYRFWRDIENLPRFMRHLHSVQRLDDHRSRWVASGPAGMRVEWDAEILTDVENEHISWQSTEHADGYNAGSVHFHPAPHGRGTEVKIVIRYTPPAGTLGAAFAKLFPENPEQQIAEDLRRFKSLIEAGEVPTTTGQPTGTSSPLGRFDASDVIESLH
jgi:uncharacterized membrane protein